MTELASLENLTGVQRALLLKRLRTSAGAGKLTELEAEPALIPHEGLSSAQVRMWLLDQLMAGGSAYVIPVIRRYVTHINAAILEGAINEIVNRHEVLRTSYAMVDNTIDASTLGSLHIPLEISRRVRWKESGYISRFSKRPFDLSTGPLLRCLLIRSREQDTLVVCFHHIVFDGTSIAIFMRELNSLYKTMRVENPSRLKPLQAQYSDYVAQEREWLKSPSYQTHIDYWSNQLRQLPTMALPRDKRHNSVPLFVGRRIRMAWSDATSAAVRRYARSQRTTVFTVLLAAFKCLLSELTDQSDIVVGVPVEGRSDAKFVNVIGLFVNTVVLRTDITGALCFDDVLERVKPVVEGGLTHQQLPFDKLVDHLRPPRDPSRNPLFQVGFQVRRIGLAKNVVDVIGIDKGWVKLDLNLELFDNGKSISGRLEYRTEVFEDATVKRIARSYRTLVSAAVRKPQLTLDQLAIGVSEPWGIANCNPTLLARAADFRYSDLFIAQAAQTPDNIAATYGTDSIDYRGLAERVGNIATLLLMHGLGPGRLVAIWMRPSIDMLAALLGILASGAAYVPIDPDAPVARVSAIFEDSNPQVILADGNRSADLARFSVPALFVGDMQLADCPSLRVPIAAADDPAYVIYTSGSTGKPKGVEISQRSLVNFVLSINSRLTIGIDDRILAITPISFDISVLELLAPLISGARVILVDRASSKNGYALIDVIESSQPTIVQATPSTWNLLMAAGWAGAKERWLVALCGGEALPWELAEQLLDRSTTLINLYGPTEATVWVSAHNVERSDGKTVLSGPLDNVEISILDDDLRPVDVGSVGEIYLGGVCLATGYRNRDDLTAERFVVDPTAQSKRIYRTGDRARALPDGKFEIIGRTDHQVKIRGNRVELGEIEAAIRSTGVRECAVILLDNQQSRIERLVAFVSGGTVDTDILSVSLLNLLPDYMRPSQIVSLAELPRTSAGKIDRKGLGNRLASEQGSQPPTKLDDPIGDQLAGIWGKVLGRSDFEVDSDFFDLGGSSLSLVLLRTQIEQCFKITISMMDLYNVPTLAGQTEYVQHIIKTGSTQS